MTSFTTDDRYYSLFQPFLRLDLFGAGLDPESICDYCATGISNLVERLRSIYGVHRMCVTVVSAIYSAASIHLLNLPEPSATVHFVQAIGQ